MRYIGVHEYFIYWSETMITRDTRGEGNGGCSVDREGKDKRLEMIVIRLQINDALLTEQYISVHMMRVRVFLNWF